MGWGQMNLSGTEVVMSLEDTKKERLVGQRRDRESQGRESF